MRLARLDDQRDSGEVILSASKVYDYVVNPYVSCQHACSYCYARFMKRFTGHREPWGYFVDVRVNAPDLLRTEIARKRLGRTWLSGVCDPYQLLEARYLLTRRCLEILAEHDWPVAVQTKSPWFCEALTSSRREDAQVGLSVTTATVLGLQSPSFGTIGLPPISAPADGQAVDQSHHVYVSSTESSLERNRAGMDSNSRGRLHQFQKPVHLEPEICLDFLSPLTAGVDEFTPIVAAAAQIETEVRAVPPAEAPALAYFGREAYTQVAAAALAEPLFSSNSSHLSSAHD